jgi:phosphoribosylamine--glycine ligase
MSENYKVLVVGSWAKEQITIENISKNPNIEVFSYMDIRNPAIMQLVKGYQVGSFYNVEEIAKYSQEQHIDLVIITTAAPLSMGLVDLLERNKILVFGPNRLAAKLESDKEFTRKLLQKFMPGVIPSFSVFDNSLDATYYAEKMGWQVAVKPVGLTDGLGVRVFGDQLKNEDEVREYIQCVVNKKLGGSSRVIVEEKLDGEEFSIQCFVNDEDIISTPSVQDFKKLLHGNRGPNTASMGSYSCKSHLLPFMKNEDYEKALDIIRRTLYVFKKETGKICTGFLYGQFMKTKKGIKLIEYNFRPGDPEWINTIFVLKNNIMDIILDLLQGIEPVVCFEEYATVCKYIVPVGYPEKLNQVLDIELDIEAIKKIENLSYYYSCGLDNDGKLNVGTERGIAFIAKANTIKEANEKVEKAVSMLKGEFHYRKDIGIGI